MAAPAASDDHVAPEITTLRVLPDNSNSARVAVNTAGGSADSAGQAAAVVSSSKPSTPAQPFLPALSEKVSRSDNTAGAFPSPQAGRGAITRSSLTRQSVGRQTSLSSRVCGARTKSTRSGGGLGASEQQRDRAETLADPHEAHRSSRNYGGSSPNPAICSEISPSYRGRGAKSSARAASEAGAAATPVSTTDEGVCGRGLRRVAADVVSAGVACAATPQAAVDESSSTAAATPASSVDYRGPRRSLRQALLANSVKTQAPAPAGCASTAGEGPLGVNTTAAANGSGPGAQGAALAGGVGAFTGPGATTGGRRRMRQPHRQLLQSYVVGQQHQQSGPQADERTACLAEWLDIRGNVPRCCCGASCTSCNSNCSSKANSSRADEGTFGSATRGGGSSTRSILDAYGTAAGKRDRQQRLPAQQQCSVGPGCASQPSDVNSGDGILVCPSWFESPIELDIPSELSCIRPSSPSRSAFFASQQAAWEEEDISEAAEAAATTAGTPWPKGSTSCSFGGYGLATRNGGQVPLCCYCGLPLRPPAVSSLRAGAESGCPLAAAAAAAAALGLDGWTQWCRCCTRVYGDLRLQHQRNATGLPFKSFSLPKAPLRYLLLPADGAKDTPGGAGAVAAALAAAAVADSRRNKVNDENGSAASAEADGDPAGVSTGSTPNNSSKSSSSTGNVAPLRRTRSGHHFGRAPAARSGSRSNNNPSDIMRFMGASCCWPSSVSNVSYVQPLARIQQRLTQLQQHHADQAQQQQQQQHRVSVEGPALATLRPSHVDGVKVPSLSTTANSSLAAAAAQTGVTPSSQAVEAVTLARTGTRAAAGASNASETKKSADVGEAVTASLSVAGIGSLAAPADATALAAPAASQTAGQPLVATDAPVASDSKQSCCPGASQASDAPELSPAKTETSIAKARTVVIPRVYLESSSDCYVATAFDSVRLRLLQKRFCCTVLGEQRAHALACQWLRWVSKGDTAAAQKFRMPQAQVNTALGVQTVPAAAVVARPPAAVHAEGFSTVPTVTASPGRRAAAGGFCGVRRGPHREDSGGLSQHNEQLRSERHLKRRRRCGEALEGSDRDEGSFPTQRFSAAATHGQQMEGV